MTEIKETQFYVQELSNEREGDELRWHAHSYVTHDDLDDEDRKWIRVRPVSRESIELNLLIQGMEHQRDWIMPPWELAKKVLNFAREELGNEAARKIALRILEEGDGITNWEGQFPEWDMFGGDL